MASQWLVDQSPQGGCEKSRLQVFAMQSFARFWSNTNAFFALSKKGVAHESLRWIGEKGNKNRRREPQV